MIETLTNNTVLPEADVLTPEFIPVLKYWDDYVPQFINNSLDSAETLDRPPTWWPELRKKASSMKLAAINFARELRLRTIELQNCDTTEHPDEFLSDTESWYRTLGPTAEMSDAGSLLLPIVAKLKGANVANSEQPKRDLLCGVMLHDVALASPAGNNQDALLNFAKREYANVLGSVDSWAEPVRRQAANLSIDISFKQLLMDRETKTISYDEFDKQYRILQMEQTRQLESMLKPENKVPTGELFENYAALMVRHQLWTTETHENAEVRRALPREDRAVYPWPTRSAPIWSYDMVVKLKDKVSLFQLKSEDMSQAVDKPHYMPPVRLVVDNSRNLRQYMNQVVQELHKAYSDFEAIEDDAVIKNACQKFAVLVS